MTSPKAETVPSPLFRRLGSITLAAMLVLAVASSPVSAQSASPESGSPPAGAQAKKPRPAAAGQPSRPAGAKAKSRARATAKTAKPASESAAQSADADEKVSTTRSVGTSETVNFETDADDRKMEPGYELIQAAPRRARHRSLVPASPSPEDSVVNRQ